MLQEEYEYYHYTLPQQIDKEIHQLEGLIKGISIDGKIKRPEIAAVKGWCDRHSIVRTKSPFNEIIPLIYQAIEDGVLDEEERQDILWLCQQFTTPNTYFSAITSDMQRLHGMLAGIAADGLIEEQELRGLEKWLEDHQHLKGYWPFDEIDSLIISVMADGEIDEQEHTLLLKFCNEFLSSTANLVLQTPIQEDLLRDGVCAACPEISFSERLFCLTGRSSRCSKSEIVQTVSQLGGFVSPNMKRDVDYLVIGAEGSNCWAFSCYGRKVEAAVRLRRDGLPVQIIHEHDFWDAVEDNM